MTSAAFEDFLTCAICLETFKDPVSLSCHHNFCCGCLKDYWEQKETRKCPLCMRRSSKENIGINFGLKSLCISYREEQKTELQSNKASAGHLDVAPMFCREDDQALFSICEINEHKNHTLETVEELKKETESNLKYLKELRKEAVEELEVCEEIMLHSEKQEKDCVCQINVLFERWQQFFVNEQKRAMFHLREEKQRQAGIMGAELERVRRQLSSLSKSIQGQERQLQRGAVEFLTHYKQMKQTKIQTQRKPPPEGLLLNQADILGNLGYQVWKRMKHVVQYTPIILDPNTANRYLQLSEDLTCVGYRGERGEGGEGGEGGIEEVAPINPERFTNMAAVLGSHGLTSGIHQWDVKVGDHPHWVIGVAKKSVEKQEKTSISPEYGIWCLWHGNGGYTNGECNTFIPVEKCPEKIRVQLDFDSGKVCFYDAEDMCILCTHRDKFNESLYPFFSVGMAGEARTKQLQICESETI
ncbi:hypothetical protein NQD34_008630 [Periophthalmus magnuspinnatus]|nr:hypothetical protein NQD34_008630 [Periophthalmus magnuspinnatus]